MTNSHYFALFFKPLIKSELEGAIQIECVSLTRKTLICIWEECGFLKIEKIRDFYSNDSNSFQDYQKCSIWIKITDLGHSIIDMEIL